MRPLAALLALLLLAGCAPLRRQIGYPFACSGVFVCGHETEADRATAWEHRAWKAAALDITSGVGRRELNPVLGENPSVLKAAAVNAAILSAVHLALRDAPPTYRKQVYRIVAVLRFAAAAYNLTQR